MLTEIYSQALLVNENLADQVWEAWDGGEIDNAAAMLAWQLVAFGRWTSYCPINKCK